MYSLSHFRNPYATPKVIHTGTAIALCFIVLVKSGPNSAEVALQMKNLR